MATRHARTADKSTNDKHTRILKALLQKPENRFCVDCRKKDPRWASFNLGCFMCIRCSGVHRSMGTHITKVKSVDLDSWTVEQVENMIKWGNEKANMYWEARLPESSVPNESTSGIDPWIRSKYEYKQFATKGAFPDPSELGPIDEAMLMQLYGKSDGNSRLQAHMDRPKESLATFGTIAPPPSNPTRSSFPKRPTSSGVQGADLFSIGQGSSSTKASAQVDFFGLNDPVPAAPKQQAQKPTSTNTAAEDLFSITAPSSTPTTNSQHQSSTPKAGNADWKNSIMSLYGNQSSAPKPNTNGFGMGQLQGMDAFGFGQAPVQQQQLQQQPYQQQQHQNNPWGNDDGFGAMQHAPGAVSSNSSFGAFHSGANNNTMNMNHNTNNNNNNNNGFGNNINQNSNGMPQGGDFFSMIAGAARSPVASPPTSNKNSSAFGDLTWN
ncbi:hypothetical protein BGX28_001575 [Mortierella sp. GBA30]|nr:hypothetical protein BGX28_001575 [Mortierella sp. GBA30]